MEDAVEVVRNIRRAMDRSVGRSADLVLQDITRILDETNVGAIGEKSHLCGCGEWHTSGERCGKF